MAQALTYVLPEDCPVFTKEYAYYTAKFAVQQAEANQFNMDFGLPLQDLAYAKAIERLRQRQTTRYSWEEQKAAFKNNLALRAYAAAVGVPVPTWN